MKRIKLYFLFTLCLFTGMELLSQTLEWGDGVNLQPSYYNGGDVDLGFELMNFNLKIHTVRIEIEPDEGVPISTVKSWISEANRNGKNVICTYHDWQNNGTDVVGELIKAANWWRQNYANLSSAGYFTINLMNEWGSHDQIPSSYASAYNDAIDIVRDVYSGPIIIDIPGWGQETDCARDASSMIVDQNIVFSVHIYKDAWVGYGSTGTMNNNHLNNLASSGRPCIIGEFGNGHSGSADWSGLVNHARSLGWTIIGWAWNGCGKGMNMTSPFWQDNPHPNSFTKTSYFNVIYNKLRSGYLNVAPKELNYSSNGGTKIIYVSSSLSGKWIMESNNSWLSSIDGISASRHRSVPCSVSANNSPGPRNGIITVKQGGITRTIKVYQSGRSAGDIIIDPPGGGSSFKSVKAIDDKEQIKSPDLIIMNDHLVITGADELLEYTVFNMTGMIMLKGTGNVIDISGLTSNMYILKTNTNNIFKFAK